MSRTRRWLRYGLTTALVGSVLAVVQVTQPVAAAAATLPANFQEQVVFAGLNQPTNIEFSPDGRIFVAEKRGVIKVFDNLADTTATVFADLSTQVHNQWDRGLLGLALPPNFPTNPWVYVLYSYDAAPGHVAPQWNDVCANANNGTCIIQGRLSRLQASGNVMTGTEQVLITDWCQQFPSHSVGDLHFGADGMLYATGGDGASFDATDYGQLAGALNPCSDPPGGAMTAPTAEGGALRSQDLRTTADPTSLNGAVLRLDPNTGAAAAGNPNIGSADLNARRIVAHGLRNPYHFTMRPGTNEVWAGDVGWTNWEEIDRVVNPTAGVTNFGWPCYEGNGTQGGYDGANLNLCESLYSGGGATQPYYAYNHTAKVVSTETCPTGSSSVTGTAFYPSSGGVYPASYNSALFFSDYSRGCIWAMKAPSAGALPSTASIEVFVAGAAQPVDLAVGPGNELYYVDIGGTVRRIRYTNGNNAPTAVISATPTTGAPPLAVSFNGTGSTDPDPADQGRLTYGWDFTNNGSIDSTSATPTFTYTTAGIYTARLVVTDSLGITGSTTTQIIVGNDVPTATIDTPTLGTTWKAGDTITFTGHGTDQQDGNLAASRLLWKLRMQHCSTPTNCHSHFLTEFPGVASGSFVAPDHEYPSYLELELTATDSSNLSHTVVRRLDPQTTTITMASSTPGLQLSVGAVTGVTPFDVTLIKNSVTTISAPTPQTLGATNYTFSAWSDGGIPTHVINAPLAATTYTATFTAAALPCADSFGYTCTDGVRTFTPANTTVLTLTGDDAFQQISTPFPVKLYGGSYSTAWVDTNGLLSFQALGQGSYGHSSIPSTGGEAAANLAVYPFWEDFIVDGSASVRTATTGTAPNRKFIVEWRNVVFYRDPAARISFEVIFDETSGVINFAYSGIDSVAEEQGSLATVGIENAAGTVALQYAYRQTVLRSGNGVTFTPPGTTPPTAGSVTGTVTSGGTAFAGATVTLAGVGSTTSAANGTYTFASVPTGSYTVTAASTGSVCSALTGSTPVTVSSGATATANIAVTGTTLSDSFGYTCSDGVRTFTPANTTVLTLTGDDAFQQISTPFPIKLYGGSYSTAWVDTNGLVSFQALSEGAYGHSAIPSTGGQARANLAVYPFWEDFIVDASASVRTATTGSAPNRKFIVEWRNIVFYRDPTARISFEVIFDETTGVINFAYSGIDSIAEEQGSLATVGIENGAGTVALQYAFQQTVLRSGNGVTFTPPGSTPPATGGVSGTVTSGGTAVSGATVTLPGVGTTTTAANGTYSFATVAVGSYTVTASSGASVCAALAGSTPVTVSSGATATANVAVTGTTLTDSFGYRCSDGVRTFTPANTTVLTLTGDDAFQQISTPFPVKLYGGSYSTAWVDTNGLLSFQALGQGSYGHSSIPSTGGEAAANLAVYPFWEDFIVDGSASVRTATTGTAPNRKFIVEWRNVVFYRDPAARISFEVIFDETSGVINFAYSGIDSVAEEQGSLATVGIENAAGTVALQYAYRQTVLRSGNGVTFTPPGA